MNSIVIIGSNGYLGQHLAHKLLSNKANNVFCFDIQQSSLVDKVQYSQLNLNADLSTDVQKIILSANCLFLLSGLTGTFKSVERFRDFVEVNELGLLKVLDLISKSEKKPKIIFPSTRLVYKGAENKLLNEDAEKEFKTVYAVNKFACESYLAMYNNLFGINYQIYRICVPYGNLLGGELSFGTLSHFINKAKANESIVLYGDGQLRRTFTHIDDLTNLMTLGAARIDADNQVFNIGSDDHLTLLEVAQKIADIYGTDVKFSPFPSIDLAIESGDTIFDGSKLTKLLNYKYQHSFQYWANQLKS